MTSKMLSKIVPAPYTTPRPPKPGRYSFLVLVALLSAFVGACGSAPCKTDKDCLQGEMCNVGKMECVPNGTLMSVAPTCDEAKCASEGKTCGAGNVCVAKMACTSDSQCNGQKCVSNVCKPRDNDEACSDNAHCASGYCRPEAPRVCKPAPTPVPVAKLKQATVTITDQTMVPVSGSCGGRLRLTGWVENGTAYTTAAPAAPALLQNVMPLSPSSQGYIYNNTICDGSFNTSWPAHGTTLTYMNVKIEFSDATPSVTCQLKSCFDPISGTTKPKFNLDCSPAC